MLNLHIVPESPLDGPRWACAEIRLLRPYQHPWLNSRVVTTVGKNVPSSRVDAIVAQRSGTGEPGLDYVVDLVRQARLRGIPLIYDIDDDLLAEHPSPPLEGALAQRRPQVRFLAREADLVTVSTAVLAERMARFNDNVHVWKNALDERLVLPLRHEEGADLGYFGTASHLEDLLSVLESLQAGLAGIKLRPVAEICGVADNDRVTSLLAGLCDVSTRPPNSNYPVFVREFQQRPAWKAGLSPVAGNHFNRGKSDIKFLDYALFGIAGVYPRGGIHDEVVHGETGMLAGPGEWGEMVRALIEDPALRRRIRANAREHLLQTRTLERRVPELWDIVQTCL